MKGGAAVSFNSLLQDGRHSRIQSLWLTRGERSPRTFFAVGFFGQTSYRFRQENADWRSAKETLLILDTAISTLLSLSGVQTGSQSASLSTHLQPRSLPFLELLLPLVAGQLASLEPLDRTFPSSARFNEMAEQIKLDQIAVFAMLGIQEDRS